MQSDVSRHVQPQTILNQILNTPLTMSVGEVIGTSREVTQHLQDVIRAKCPQSVSGPSKQPELISAAMMYMRSWRLLISFTVYCDGNPIEAIVDIGSMMNKVKQYTKNIYHVPATARKGSA